MSTENDSNYIDTGEPYAEVGQLFDGDRYAKDPDSTMRDEWLVLSNREIRHEDVADLEKPIGRIATEHLIVYCKEDYDNLNPGRQREIDSCAESVKDALEDFFDEQDKKGTLFE